MTERWNYEAEVEDAPVLIPCGDITLEGAWTLPAGSDRLVVFVHGSGSSRMSPRNRQVARVLNRASMGTLLLDLLTAEEDLRDRVDSALRFDLPRLTERVVRAIDWATTMGPALSIGLFGASTGAAAALFAAAERPSVVRAIVSRGGRPDLAFRALSRVTAPTLLIVGALDHEVLALNERAFDVLACKKRLHVVAGATHLFEEPGALEEVSKRARGWFEKHLGVGSY